MFDIVYATPASPVATAGTIAFSYPEGKNAGSYAAFGHKAQIRGLMNSISQDDGQMSVAFTSVITLTYKGATSIPAGSLVSLQVNRTGQDDGDPSVAPAAKRMLPAPLYLMQLGAPKAIDDDAICESQTVTGVGTAFVLDGVQSDLYAGVNVKLDVPRAVNAGWTNTAIITITGEDEYGDVMIETSASGVAHTGKKAFSKIVSIKTNATITGAKVGILDVLGLPAYVQNAGQIVGEFRDNRSIGVVPGKIRLPFSADQVTLLAGTTMNLELVSPVDGVITKMVVVTRLAPTTGGAVTAAVGVTAVDGLSVAVANGSAKGTTTSDTPTAGHASTVVTKNARIQIILDDAFASAGAIDGYIEIEPTGVGSGTFVAGVQTLPTGTTGDVRGTYDPEEACDGSLSFALLVSCPDPSYRGVDNYDG